MSSFHYDFILSERSTLAKVWLAAHWEKKLSKVQVFETNLLSSVHDILHPITPIALRTSSHLLVGLARIYSRKAKYLLTDCSEALVNIKVAFRPGAQILDEPKKKKRSQVDCPLFITEKVDLLDQWVPEASNAEMDCSLNQSKIEEITIQEEPMKVSSLEDYFDDEGFGDMFDCELTEQELEKGESSFLRVHSFADSDCVLEDSFSYSSSITDFSDPFLSTPVKEVDEINKLKNRTLETQSEIDILKCVSELDEEMPEVRNLPEGDHVKLHIKIRNNHGDKQEKIVLDPIVEKSVKPSRKSLKRKLLVDSEISIDREEYFYQIRDASRLCAMPVMAPHTKCHMKQIRKNAQSLFLSQSHQEFLAPCLQKLFECHKVKNNSMSSSLVEEKIAFSHIDENGEENIDSVFIPIQDVEYSDDDVNIFHNEDQKSFPDETNSASSVEDDASTEQNEDITHDEFCAFVETAVLKSHPEPINIQQVILQGSPTRKNVARRFIKCLIMQREGRLRLDQASHFSGIYLYPGNHHVSLLDCS